VDPGQLFSFNATVSLLSGSVGSTGPTGPSGPSNGPPSQPIFLLTTSALNLGRGIGLPAPNFFLGDQISAQVTAYDLTTSQPLSGYTGNVHVRMRQLSTDTVNATLGATGLGSFVALAGAEGTIPFGAVDTGAKTLAMAVAGTGGLLTFVIEAWDEQNPHMRGMSAFTFNASQGTACSAPATSVIALLEDDRLPLGRDPSSGAVIGLSQHVLALSVGPDAILGGNCLAPDAAVQGAIGIAQINGRDIVSFNAPLVAGAKVGSDQLGQFPAGAFSQTGVAVYYNAVTALPSALSGVQLPAPGTERGYIGAGQGLATPISIVQLP
jgi:hypothetical protein